MPPGNRIAYRAETHKQCLWDDYTLEFDKKQVQCYNNYKSKVCLAAGFGAYCQSAAGLKVFCWKGKNWRSSSPEREAGKHLLLRLLSTKQKRNEVKT